MQNDENKQGDAISEVGKSWFSWWKEAALMTRNMAVVSAAIVIIVAYLCIYKPWKSEPATAEQTITGSNTTIHAEQGALVSTAPQLKIGGANSGIAAIQTNPTNSPITQTTIITNSGPEPFILYRNWLAKNIHTNSAFKNEFGIDLANPQTDSVLSVRFVGDIGLINQEGGMESAGTDDTNTGSYFVHRFVWYFTTSNSVGESNFDFFVAKQPPAK